MLAQSVIITQVFWLHCLMYEYISFSLQTSKFYLVHSKNSYQGQQKDKNIIFLVTSETTIFLI